MNTKSGKKIISTVLTAIIVLSAFAAMCTPVSANGDKAMISLKDSDGTDQGVQVGDLEEMGIEIIDVGENFITVSVTEEQFHQLKEEGYLVAWLKEGAPEALGAITGPVAIFQDRVPWGFTSNQDILTANGISYTIYSSAQIGVVDLSGFEKVIIASVQPTAFYTAVEANSAWFESYASNGGILEIHAAPYSGSPWPTGVLPCGFTWTQNPGQTVDIALPGYDILTTPNVITDAELDGWNYAYHGYFTGYPAGSQIILTEGDTGFANPVLITAPYGSGCVIASGQTLEWGYWRGDSNLLENVLLYECRVDPWQEINAELDALIDDVNAADITPEIIKRSLVNKLERAKTFKEVTKIAYEAGNSVRAKRYLELSKRQVESFSDRVKITDGISPADKASFLADSTEIQGKIQALIEYIETEHKC